MREPGDERPIEPGALLGEATRLLGATQGARHGGGSMIAAAVIGVAAALMVLLSLIFVGLAGMWLLDDAVPLWVAALIVGVVFMAPAVLLGVALRRSLSSVAPAGSGGPPPGLDDSLALLSSILAPPREEPPPRE